MVMEVVVEDMGDGNNMQCTNHPYKNNTQGGGGICAFCLQEKLGKLVSSSLSVAIFPSSSSLSSSPSLRSDHHFGGTTTKAAATATTTITTKKKKKKDGSIVFKRSKSTATANPRHHHGMHFLDDDENYHNPSKKGFWSFLYSSSSSSSSSKHQITKKNVGFALSSSSSRERKREEFDENNEQTLDQSAAFDRKVSRSKSVGCGSRSFSGDIFEKISTGLGDCTLRRVESQREGKINKHGMHKNGGFNGQDSMKERVKCGGIFGGFAITTSSSSSSTSSSYWLSSSSTHEDNVINGRSKSWGWALASPMRAFTSSKPSSVKTEAHGNKNATPNLAAIPSLLVVRN